MRWESGSRERDYADRVLFDPAALADLLALDPHPRAAFCRFPRRLQREEKRGNALTLSASAEGRVVLEGEDAASWEVPEFLVEKDPVRLRLPSGKLFVAAPEHPASAGAREPAERIGEVAPGLYRVRRFARPNAVGDEEVRRLARERLDPEEREILDRHRKLTRRLEPVFKVLTIPLGIAAIVGLAGRIGKARPVAYDLHLFLLMFVIWATVLAGLAWWRSAHHPHTRRILEKLKSAEAEIRGAPRPSVPPAPSPRVCVLERV